MITQKDKEIFLQILSAAVSGEKICCIPKEADVRALYILSCVHKVSGAVWCAVKDAEPLNDDQREFLSRLRADVANAGKKLVLQDYYTDTICAMCRDKGVKFALLKGAVLKHLYPDEIMRSSCDVDILVDRDRIDEIIQLLCELGFDYHEEADGDEAKHAKLVKEGVVIELHRMMCVKGSFGGYYDEPFSVFESNDGVEYTLCPEELLVYNLAHASGHFMKGVNSLRAIGDVWIINRKCPEMDKEKLSRLLEKTGLYEFETAMANLAMVFFGNKKAKGDLAVVTDYVLMNPVRADTPVSEFQKAKMSGNSEITRRINVVLRRVFPPYEMICRRHPNASRSKLLYPYYVVKRFVDAGIQGRVKEQLEAIRRISGDEMNTISIVRKYAGL